MSHIINRNTIHVFIPHLSEKMGQQTLFEQKLTIVHPFYNDETRLIKQVEAWSEYETHIKKAIQFILVDDGSQNPLHKQIEKIELPPDLNLDVYRIDEDLKWNTPGALNLGIEKATTDWILIMDSDCLLDNSNLKWITKLRPDLGFMYRFNRQRITNLESLKGHERFLGCTILFSKATFLDVGGFDEDFTGKWSGGYGFFDNEFVQSVLEKGYMQGVLQGPKVTEYMEDIVGPNVQQRTGVRASTHHRINKILWGEKKKGKIPRVTKRLRFEWEKVFSTKEDS